MMEGESTIAEKTVTKICQSCLVFISELLISMPYQREMRARDFNLFVFDSEVISVAFVIRKEIELDMRVHNLL